MEQLSRKKMILPRTSSVDGMTEEAKAPLSPERPGIYSCLCCGQRTFPNPPEAAAAYICPVCWWENDVFTASADEPSDENHGLTLNQGRENFRQFGICDPRYLRCDKVP